MRNAFAFLWAGACLALIVAVGCAARGDSVRLGAAAGASATVFPLPAVDATLELCAGVDRLDVSAWTEYSLFPYTMGSQTIAVSWVEDWLGLTAEYRFSLVPIGITRAVVSSRAQPAPWQSAAGGFLFSLAVEGEARLTGDTFGSSALRTEIWAKASVGASRAIGGLGPLSLGVSIETTLSAPGGGVVWPTPELVASATMGHFTLRSETTLSMVGDFRIAAETLALEGSWSEFGISGSVWCTLSEDAEGLSLGVRLAAEFGDSPLAGFRFGGGCAGGVCR